MVVIVGLLFSVVVAAVCLWPTWIWLIARSMLHPVGFWENLVTVGLGFYFLAGLQVLFLIIMFFALIALWTELFK
jgi:hypothetical protein